MPHELTDGEARIVASWWHSSGSMGRKLAALSTSGAVLHGEPEYSNDGVLDEIDYCKRHAEQPADIAGLDALAAYCRRVGPRDPVSGWAHLSWDSADERALEAKLNTPA